MVLAFVTMLGNMSFHFTGSRKASSRVVAGMATSPDSLDDSILAAADLKWLGFGKSLS